MPKFPKFNLFKCNLSPENVIDADEWAWAGLDPKRWQDTNLNVLDSAFANMEIKMFEKDRLRSKRISIQDWKDRSMKDRVLEKLSILFRSQF